MKLQDVIDRALAADKTPCDYRMGAGVKSAKAPVPWAPFSVEGHFFPRGCDCSAFACWASGVDKYDGEAKCWYGTDRIFDDAQGKQRRFRRLASPVPSCLVVYPGYDKGGKRRAGHVGVVLDPGRHFIIDCADSPDDDAGGVGDGITQRVANFFWDPKPAFRKPAIFVVAVHLEDAPRG